MEMSDKYHKFWNKITKILSCLVVVGILMSVVPVTLATDNTPPLITDGFDAFQDINYNVRIETHTVYDHESSLNWVKLFYKVPGSPSYGSKEMQEVPDSPIISWSLQDHDDYYAIIPSSEITESGTLSYYIEARNSEGLIADSATQTRYVDHELKNLFPEYLKDSTFSYEDEHFLHYGKAFSGGFKVAMSGSPNPALGKNVYTYKLTIEKANDGLLDELYGYGASQILVFFNRDEVEPLEVTNSVDGATPLAIDLADNVHSLLTFGVGTSVKEIVIGIVKSLAKSCGKEAATKILDFVTPPEVKNYQTDEGILVDFSSNFWPASPAKFDKYDLTFTAKFKGSKSSPIIFVPDMSGKTIKLPTASPITTTLPLLIEYRRELIVTPPVVEVAKGYPHLEAEYTVNPESISSIDDEVVVALRIKGIGGKAEDLPLDILEKLPRKPLDVVLVLDRSGSMESTDYPPDRITAAKEAAKIFVSQIKEDDRVAVVSFAESTSTVVSFTSDKDSAKRKIGGISPGGGTAVGEGIITALDVLEKGREESVKAIVLLSDGANNRGTSPKTAANRAKGRGIPIYTVGIGTVGGGKDPLDEQTLKEIASITGGEYLYAPDESELKRVYEILSTKVLNVAGTKVSVSVEPTPFFNILKEEPSPLRFENIPPDTEKTVEITGKLTITAPNERIPIINKYTISYLDIIGKYKTIIGGPIYVEYNVETVPSDVEIRNIEFKKEDGSYKDAIVYHLSNDIIAEVEIRNPDDVTVKSTASIYEGNTGKGFTDSKKTDKDSITHILNNGGVIGRHIFSDSLYYPGDIQTDNKGDIVYTVFDDEDDVDDKWYDGEKMFSNRWWGFGKVTLHPKSNDILRFATISSSGAALKDKAAKRILHYVHGHIEYNLSKGNCNWDNDLTILDLNGKNSKGGKTGEPVGLCVDYAAAYISCLRSINIPARGIGLNYDYYDHSKGKKEASGHAFSEVYDDAWRHYDPTWNEYVKPDVYLLDSKDIGNIYGSVEQEPGKLKEDKLTTIKYAVGMIYPHPYAFHPQITINLNEGTTTKPYLFFENRAKSTDARWNPFDSEKYIAEDFDIEIIDSGRLEVKVKNLRGDDTLDINELDYCILKIKVPEDYAKTIKEGSSVTIPIKLKVNYETIDGEEVEKDYIIKVRVER